MSTSVRVVLGLCIVTIALLACMPTFSPTPLPTPVPIDVPASTATPIPTWTSTPAPTSTSTPEPTVAPTFTPTLIPIASSAPLLFSEVVSVVHTVLFYSPTCPHCHYVMEEVLPPLQQEFGDQLVVATMDVSTPEELDIYYAAVDHLAIPNERLGVPTMIVGDTVLVGAEEIPMLLPDLIRQGLDEGGIDWPEIPGFAPPPEE